MNRRTIAAPIIAFAAIALAALGRPLWFDEVLTLTNFVFGRSIGQIYHSYVIPNNHILYSFLLRGWCEMPLFGGLVTHFRLLSCLLGLGFMVSFAAVFRKRLGMSIAVLLLLGFVLSPAALIYGTAVRGYMLSALLTIFVLHFAFCFAAEPTKKNGILYTLFSLLAVATIPSNLFAIGCAVCAVIPVMGTHFWKKRQFYYLVLLPFVTLMLFYGPILPDLLRCFALHEGMGDRWGVLYQLLLAASSILTFFLPFALAGTLKAVSLKRLKRTWPRWVLLFLPFLPCFVLTVAPFPRTFFACAPVLLYCAGLGGRHLLAAARLRRGKASGKTLFYFCFFAMLLAGGFVQSHREMLSSRCGGEAFDDFFAPYYVRKGFAPDKLVGFLQKEFPDAHIYCTFDSDPYSILFCSDCFGGDGNRFGFDNPRGRAQGKFDFIIARHDESAEPLESRFGAKPIPVEHDEIPSFFRLYRLRSESHE